MATYSHADIEYIQQAFELADKGLYTADPNPRVGCLIVNNDIIVGRGWHQYAGGPHAEVAALKQAGSQAQNATAYVSLEPCSFQGRTSPCTEALIAAGIKRVVGAMTDPHPNVSGQGFSNLQQAGIEVVSECQADNAKQLNPGYWKRLTAKLPWVRVKMAATLDGRTATATGQSKWLTGSAARADVQFWRARSSAVVTGSGTVLVDDPAMTVRDSQFACDHPEWQDGIRQPLRVVVDRRGRVSPTAKIFQEPGNALWLTAKPPVKASATAITLSGQWQPLDVLTLLAERGCNEVLIEAGAGLAGAFMAAGLVDEIVLYLAPSLLGSNARPLLQLTGIEDLADQIKLQILTLSQIGDDIRVVAKPKQVKATNR